jgi:sodium transport system permease protein
VLSALLFGFLLVLMSLFQQLFNATLLGLVLGLLAVRSASLLPGIVFHAINNGLALVVGAVAAGELGSRVAPWLFRDAGQGLYHGVWVGVGAVVSVVLIAALWRDRAPVRLDEPSAPGVPVP